MIKANDHPPQPAQNPASNDIVQLEPIAIVDVHYWSESARAACLIAQNWAASDADQIYVTEIANVRPYVPGHFFERELPCIVAVLAKVELQFTAILIDGYVHLDERGTPGLGHHLYAHYDGRRTVVGVAKTAYGKYPAASRVLRGCSKRPLFVTGEGIGLAQAARLVSRMHGAHRIPTLLAQVDRLARDGRLPTK